MAKLNVDICVLGAGAGGLSVAAGAVQMGAAVALIEKDKMGGDCLNRGCVPSKSFLTVAKLLNKINHAERFGVLVDNVRIDCESMHAYMHSVIDNIAPKDSEDRYSNLGVNVFKGAASFINEREVQVNEQIIRAKYFVIATGSRPAVLAIPGLDKINYLTNETIFYIKECPEHLIIIGGGPIGCEMAQAHSMMGAGVTLIQHSRILKKDDLELTTIIRDQFIKNGIRVYEDADIIAVAKADNKISVVIKQLDNEIKVIGSHLLVAVGRQPDIAALKLENAKVEFNKRGIIVDKRLRSSNKRIFAVGDVAGSYQFTHVSSYHASVVLQNILFHWSKKVNYNAVPWVTYTEPELAHVGLNEEQARAKYRKVKVLKYPFAENDRAQAEGNILGMIKVVTTKNGRILGSSIVGAKAGELIGIWCLAISKKLNIKAIAKCILPYPTRVEISKQVAGTFFTPMLFSAKMQKIVKFIMRIFS